MKRIGFLSEGRWHDDAGSPTRCAADSLVQTIEIAQAAEEIGIDDALVRVHHFEQKFASPFPLLAAIAARTHQIGIGTAVVDMRYENPLHMAEEAAAVDLISKGRLQLGISRGAPDVALGGPKPYGHVVADGETDADAARRKTEVFLAAVGGAVMASPDPARTGASAGLVVQPQSPGLAHRIWWGAGTRATGQWAAQVGMNMLSSTRLYEEAGIRFDELQAEQIHQFRQAWAERGWARDPKVSVLLTVLPITRSVDRANFGGAGRDEHVRLFEGVTSRFGKTFTGEPDVAIQQASVT